MAKVSVIVPAAGAGTRFGGKGNKILQRLGNGPVFMRTLEAFTSRPDVCQVLLVVSAADMETMRERFGGALGLMGTALVEGGPTRTQSVRNALAKVSEQADLVCVHDAVRPCVAQEWIDAVFAQAEKTGAAILACPVHGTLWNVADHQLQNTVERDGLWEAQTPQVFHRELLVRAYAGQAEATDDAAMVRPFGAVHAVPADARNIKITTARDLAFAAAVINTLPKPKPTGGLHPFDEAQW